MHIKTKNESSILILNLQANDMDHKNIFYQHNMTANSPTSNLKPMDVTKRFVIYF